MKAIAYNFLHIGIGVLLTFALLLGLVGFIYYRERKRRLKMPNDPLAELTGSKHSLASTHPVNQKPHRHQCPNAHKPPHPHPHSHHHHHHHHHPSSLHQHSRSHHNSRTHLPTDVDSLGKGTLTRTGSLSLGGGSTLGKRQPISAGTGTIPLPPPPPPPPPPPTQPQPPIHHHHHHHALHETRLTQTAPHDCASRHQLIPVHEFHRTQPPTSSRLQRKSPHPLPMHGVSLSRNGGTLTGSIHSGVVGTGSSGLSVDVDGGLLIREKMQKISIV
ncbi:unnamed protein product [Echinostoma caproni]|uniref:DAG1 domain-containing protein n=1 Tax=Echinostoma caproni TaxID=27848 RepID=A0A183B7D0_9TREM|nr:unnamed protein product [Echinostoma caproni]